MGHGRHKENNTEIVLQRDGQVNLVVEGQVVLVASGFAQMLDGLERAHRLTLQAQAESLK